MLTITITVAVPASHPPGAVILAVVATKNALAFGRRQLAPPLAQRFPALRRQGPETAIGITHALALLRAQVPEALPAIEAPLPLFRWQGPEALPALARLGPLVG